MKERRPCRGWIPDRRCSRGDAALRPRQTGQKAIAIVATDSNQPPKRTEAVTTECRLAALEPAVSAVPTQLLRLEFVYDGEGRRRSKKVFSWAPQTENWSLITEHFFLYDGWNLICETTTDHTQTPAVTSARSYVWGLDLSQTLQGAGGGGGLLSVTTGDASSFVAYDGNGNGAALGRHRRRKLLRRLRRQRQRRGPGRRRDRRHCGRVRLLALRRDREGRRPRRRGQPVPGHRGQSL